MHDHEWVTTQKDKNGVVVEQVCGCTCGLTSWFEPSLPDKGGGRRYGPRPVVVNASGLSADASETWNGQPIPAQVK